MTPEQIADATRDSDNFIKRIKLRVNAALIAEIILFSDHLFERKTSQITCTSWKHYIRLTEHFLLKSQPELKNVNIANLGWRKPNLKSVTIVHVCDCGIHV